jgi:hypothetical protein
MRYLTIFCFLLLLGEAIAQQQGQVPASPVPVEPIPVELVIGHNRFGLQFVMNKKFSPSSRFSFLNANIFTSDYNNSRDNLDLVAVAQVGYDFYKGFGPTVGLSVNSVAGLSPTAGVQYVFVNREILLVFSPTIEISETNNIQGLIIGEYRPALSSKVDLFSRIQALYNYDTNNKFHQRSYIQLRLGAGIGKYQFGPALNLDYYGPEKVFKGNYGAFVRFNFH